MSDQPATPEFSRPVALSAIGPRGMTVRIEAGPAERRALAGRFGILEVGSLEAEARLRWIGRPDRLAVKIALTAEVVQACSVSLEPVPERIEEEVELVFARDAGGPAREVVIETPDEAEPLEGDAIDIGELTAEELALSLEPYPRSPDIGEIGLEEAGPGPQSGPDGPFGALASLRRNR